MRLTNFCSGKACVRLERIIDLLIKKPQPQGPYIDYYLMKCPYRVSLECINVDAKKGRV